MRLGDAFDLALIDHDMARELAIAQKVCVRPLIRRVEDRQIGTEDLVAIPCGSTRDDVCPSCAHKAKVLRMQQCFEGWHRDHEPDQPDQQKGEPVVELEDQADELVAIDAEADRRVRSTRRRQDAPALPRVPQEDRTIGRTFTQPGRQGLPAVDVPHRHPRLLRQGHPDRGARRPGPLQLPPGRVGCVAFSEAGRPAVAESPPLRRLQGPVLPPPSNPNADSHRISTRRSAGRSRTGSSRLSSKPPTSRSGGRPSTNRSTPTGSPSGTAATTVTRPPARYCPRGPRRSTPWPTTLMPGRRMGSGSGRGWICRASSPPSVDADRAVRYLTKYLTKAIADAHSAQIGTDPAYLAHVDRLHHELQWLPCSPSCSNWLRYGIQPDQAEPGLQPGHCDKPAHDRANLGCGGRRVLVSRQWSGKTLAEHKADRATVVREALTTAGIVAPDNRAAGRRRAAARRNTTVRVDRHSPGPGHLCAGHPRLDRRTAALARPVRARQDPPPCGQLVRQLDRTALAGQLLRPGSRDWRASPELGLPR